MVGNSHGMLLTDSNVCEDRTLDNEARDSSIYPRTRVSRESSLLTNNRKSNTTTPSTQSRTLTTYPSTFDVNAFQTKRSKYQIRQTRSNSQKLDSSEAISHESHSQPSSRVETEALRSFPINALAFLLHKSHARNREREV